MRFFCASSPNTSIEIPGHPDSDEEEHFTVGEESIETDMELKLHVMGSKALWTQTLCLHFNFGAWFICFS